MYGYFRPNDSHLTKEERRLFQAYYCRICYCLRILGGQAARFFTTFDMAIYSILLNIAQKQERPTYHMCEKFSKRVMHEFDSDTIGRRLANMSIIVFGEKIRDDRIDGNYIRAAGMTMIFRKTIEQACKSEPEMATIARIGTDEINRLQNACCSTKEVLSVYGKMISDMFLCIFDLGEKYIRVIQDIAIWTFYVDMLYDYDKDYKTGAYNGFKVDNITSIHRLFDINYTSIMKINSEITDELREALYEIQESSTEWNTLYKVINTALSSTVFFLFCTKKERRQIYLNYVRESFCQKLPNTSNFR